MEYGDYEALPGDLVIDRMNPIFNTDGTISLTPSTEFEKAMLESYKIGEVFRLGSQHRPEKFAKCMIVSKGDKIIVRPLD